MFSVCVRVHPICCLFCIFFFASHSLLFTTQFWLVCCCCCYCYCVCACFFFQFFFNFSALSAFPFRVFHVDLLLPSSSSISIVRHTYFTRSICSQACAHTSGQLNSNSERNREKTSNFPSFFVQLPIVVKIRKSDTTNSIELNSSKSGSTE